MSILFSEKLQFLDDARYSILDPVIGQCVEMSRLTRVRLGPLLVLSRGGLVVSRMLVDSLSWTDSRSWSWISLEHCWCLNR